MGFLDRIHDAVTGLGGGVQAVPGLVWDLSRAPFVDDDVDGILGTLTAVSTSRTSQLFGNLFGPEEGLGAVVGAVPGREHLRGPLQSLDRGLETAYREGVAEPLSAAFTAGSLAASPTYLRSEGRGTDVLGQFSALLDGDTWRTADSIAETRSPGQALVLMFGTKDILDEEELERFAGTDAYVFYSGAADALSRLFLSPDVLAGKVTTGLRAGRAAATGGRLGAITTRAPLQIGGRAERFGALTVGGERIAAINRRIDEAYLRLPEPVQRLVASERTFMPEDIERLSRLEDTRRALRTRSLAAEAATSTDPTRVRVLQNVVESRQAREARLTGGRSTGPGEVRYGGETRTFGPSAAVTGETPRNPGLAERFTEAAQADIDAYFAAANKPTRKGFFSGITATAGWRRVDEFIESLPAGVNERAGLIRDRLFPTHHRGDIISRYLAEATGPAERESVMRVFLGDMRALDDLKASSYALGRQLEDLTLEQSLIRADPLIKPLGRQLTLDDIEYLEADDLARSLAATFAIPYDDVRNTPERLARIGEEINAVASQQVRDQRLMHAWRSLPAGPTYTRGQAARNAFKASSFYQHSLLGKGVRLITDMRPHHLVNSHDASADAHLGRMLREAGYDDATIARARGQFMAAEAATRSGHFERWVTRAERKVLKDAGLDEDELVEVLANARLGRNQAQALVRGAKFDGEGRARVQFHDGDEMVDVELPLSVTQLENVVSVPNFHLLHKHATRYARLKYGDDARAAIARGARPAWTAKEFGLDAMRGIMEVWRPATLLRPAWTLRVIGDEQLRQLAKFGALTVMLGARDHLRDYAAELRRNPLVDRVLKTSDPERAARRGAAISAAAGGVVAGPIGALASGALGNRLVRKMAELDEAGYVNVRFGGHAISGPFGDAGSTAEVYRTLNSARASVDELFGAHENRWYGALRRDPSRWRTHTWGVSAEDNAIYTQEWVRNLRRQVAQDDMGRQFLAGKTVDEVYDWLENTVAGRGYAAKVPWRTDRRAWVEAYADQIDAYTGGLDEVKVGILTLADRGLDSSAANDKAAAFLALIPEDQRAPIHGAATEQLTARSPLNQAVNALVNHSFDILGTMATDTLSRNPTFARFYQAEARRLFGGLKPGRVHADDVRRLEGQARDFALRETRELLYDLAEQSRFASMTRLMMPFYNAWQEVLTRWAGLAVENPVFAARARAAWSAPDAVGWTYRDDHGNNFLRIRIPDFAKGLLNQGIFASALDDQGYLFLDKGGLNLVAQGTPGFGPFAQVAVSEMVERNPTLEDSVRFVIPFGPVDTTEALLPPVARRFAAASDEESAARANAEARILTTRLAKMQTGEIPMVDFSDPKARQDFLDSVSEEAGQLMKLRVFTGFVAPVAPIFESPYKPYIDIYRALRDGDWERAREVGDTFGIPGAENLPTEGPAGGANASTTADDIFIDTFGEEFFALTQAFTKTVNGVPPTIEGLEASETFGDLISAYPEWGGVIAGYDGGGQAVQFSRAVYDRQMATGARRRLTPDEILDEPDKRLGWSRYSRYMDMIEALRVSRGLPNLQVAEAEDLRQAKRVIVLALAAKYPSWYDDYSVSDRNAWSKRIEGARAMTDNEALAGRPDVAGLKDYLAARDQLLAVLATRESRTLSSSSNQDLAALWRTMVARIVERNPEFADLYYRKLENDPVALDDAMLVSNSGP